MKKSDLRQILSSSTVAKLSKGEYISGEAIEKICLFLNCQPGDIMEITKEVYKTKDYEIYETEHINESFMPDIEMKDTVTRLHSDTEEIILDVNTEEI